jgi:hypothetical protein
MNFGFFLYADKSRVAAVITQIVEFLGMRQKQKF